jgi:hypothetical protein
MVRGETNYAQFFHDEEVSEARREEIEQDLGEDADLISYGPSRSRKFSDKAIKYLADPKTTIGEWKKLNDVINIEKARQEIYDPDMEQASQIVRTGLGKGVLKLAEQEYNNGLNIYQELAKTKTAMMDELRKVNSRIADPAIGNGERRGLVLELEAIKHTNTVLEDCLSDQDEILARNLWRQADLKQLINGGASRK